MNAPLSSTAWALHDLGLATSFGGSLFGKLALHPSVRSITDQKERDHVLSDSWSRFSVFNVLSHGLFALTWLVGRKMLSGREIDRETRTLVGVKDALIGTSLVTGIGSILCGWKGIAKEGSDEPQVKLSHKASGVLGTINLVALGGILGITALLGMKGSSSTKFAVRSRWLP